MWHDYVSVKGIDNALQVLSSNGGHARIVAGATDLILEIKKGVKKGIKTLIDVSRIPNQDQIILDEDKVIHIGPLVTHNHCVASKLIREYALPLALATWKVGSPQIRNRGTIAGNIITASPANDTITPLIALGASVMLRSISGDRIVQLQDFYTGVRQTVMKPDEIVVDIFFPAMKINQKGIFIKLALRRAQAISLVNVAIVLSLEGETIHSANVTLGSVAPTIIHANTAEKFLIGKRLNDKNIEMASELAMNDARPINDVRGSAAYRKAMTKVITKRGLKAILMGTESSDLTDKPVLLNGNNPNYLSEMLHHDQKTPIITIINGIRYEIKSGQNKSLLRLLREDVGLIGTKEGCAEGECGACTVFLDGAAVMSCMVPAPRAHGAEIITIEGLAKNGNLHPMQESFIETGAVQCGYCTPGFIMSAAKLLEERRNPSKDDIRQAITGNLCRCTGYYSIVQAIERAVEKSGV